MSLANMSVAKRKSWTQWWPRLRVHGLVEAHFAGENGGFAERRMWRHLTRCEACRLRYRAHAQLEALESDGEDRARRRMARTVFRPRPRTLRATLLAGGLAAGLAAMLIVPRALDRGHATDFASRGGDEAEATGPAAIAIYRVPNGAAPERAGAVIHAGEALAFSYTNPPSAAFRFLLIFAQDDAGRVYWYRPLWQDPASTPAAIPIRPSATALELGEAVRHPLAAGALRLYALFTNQPHDVRRVEDALARGPEALAALAEGGRLVQERIEVLP